MLKTKLLALCMCPAVLAPPAILAVHQPARHAVAHLLQRAAHRLDDHVPAIEAPGPSIRYAEIPCAPTLAEAGGAGGSRLALDGFFASLLPTNGLVYGDASRYGSGIGFGGGVLGIGAGIGGGGGGVTGSFSPIGTPGTPPTVATLRPGDQTIATRPSRVGPTASVPDPSTWALLMTGFGAVGLGLRYKRVFTA